MDNHPSIFKTAWQNISGLKKPLWGGIFYLGIFIVIGAVVFGGAEMVIHHLYPSVPPDADVMVSKPISLTIALIVILVLRFLYNIFVLLPMRFGYTIIPLRHNKGKSAQANYVFQCFHWRYIRKFVALEILFFVLLGIPSGIAALCFMAPHILSLTGWIHVAAISLGIIFTIYAFYLMISFSFSYLIAVDRKISAWKSIKLSYQTVKQHWFCVFGTCIVAWLSILLGAICLIIGLIWAIPYAQNVFVLLYDKFLGVAGEDPVSLTERAN